MPMWWRRLAWSDKCLDLADNGSQALLDHGVLLLHGLLGPLHGQELLVGLLAGQLLDLMLEVLDLLLGSPADVALSLAVW
jgi:hypothetical protein